MKKLNYIWIISALMVQPLLFAQSEQGGTESTFSLGFGARSLGLGQAYTALADDPTAVFWNPAGLEYTFQQRATFFHTTLFDAVQYDFFGYSYPTLDLGTFGFGVGRLGIGGIVERSKFNQKLGNFTNDEYQVYFAYAKKIMWGLTPGISIRWIRQGWNNLTSGDITETGVGADIGLMYRPEWIGSALVQDWSFGLNVRNAFAPQLKAGNQVDELPLTIKLGFMKKFNFTGGNSLRLLFDLDQSQSRDMRFHAGTEYSYNNFGMIRVGMNGGNFAFGAGVKYSMFRLDYGYSGVEASDVFSPAQRISISVDFGATRDDMFQLAELKRKENEDRIKREIREADKRDFVAKHLIKADEYFTEDKYIDAIVEYQQVIGMDPFHFRAGVMLDSANTMLQNQFTKRQSLAIKTALDKDRAANDSLFVQNHFNQGRTLLDKKQFIDALVQFNLALERDPKNAILQNSIVTTKRRIQEEVGGLVRKSREEFKKQNYSEALRLLGDAQLLGADDSQLQNEVEALSSRIKLQENIQQGLLLYDVGQYKEALDILGKALTLDPNNNLIKQYYERSKIETLGRQEDMDPESEQKYMVGVDTFLRGKYAAAIKIWEEILVNHPYDKRVLQSISNARERLKNSNKKD